jgi:hypothetical protein
MPDGDKSRNLRVLWKLEKIMESDNGVASQESRAKPFGSGSQEHGHHYRPAVYPPIGDVPHIYWMTVVGRLFVRFGVPEPIRPNIGGEHNMDWGHTQPRVSTSLDPLWFASKLCDLKADLRRSDHDYTLTLTVSCAGRSGGCFDDPFDDDGFDLFRCVMTDHAPRSEYLVEFQKMPL